jgi:hypothetical protein
VRVVDARSEYAFMEFIEHAASRRHALVELGPTRVFECVSQKGLTSELGKKSLWRIPDRKPNEPGGPLRVAE